MLLAYAAAAVAALGIADALGLISRPLLLLCSVALLAFRET